MTDKGLVYVGKIIQLAVIPDADTIESATVICGVGGKWRGVVKKDAFKLNDLCIVYLHDALIPESDEMRFMEKRDWRVRMCKFRGAPSEVLIMPCKYPDPILGMVICQLRARANSPEEIAICALNQTCVLAMFCREHIELIQQLISNLDYREITDDEINELKGE